MTHQTGVSNPKPAAAGERPIERSPFMIEFYMVEGAGFRCMAYQDESGKWRSAFNNVELFGDIRILE